MSEKNTSRFIGGGVHPPFGCHGNHLPLIWKMKIFTIDAWDNFDNTCKKSFSYLKERSHKSFSLVDLNELQAHFRNSCHSIFSVFKSVPSPSPSPSPVSPVTPSLPSPNLAPPLPAAKPSAKKTKQSKAKEAKETKKVEATKEAKSSSGFYVETLENTSVREW